MPLEQIIILFERLEKDNCVAIDINLHKGIKYVMEGNYETFHNKEGTFSSFLKDLVKTDYPA